MATSPIDLSAGLVEKSAPVSQQIDLSAGLVTKPASQQKSFSERIGERIQGNLDVPAQIHAVNQAIQTRNAERAQGVPAHGLKDIWESLKQYGDPANVVGDLVSGYVTGKIGDVGNAPVEEAGPRPVRATSAAPETPSLASRVTNAALPRAQAAAARFLLKRIPGAHLAMDAADFMKDVAALPETPKAPVPTGPPELWGKTIPAETAPEPTTAAASRPMAKRLAAKASVLGPPQADVLGEIQNQIAAGQPVSEAIRRAMAGESATKAIYQNLGGETKTQAPQAAAPEQSSQSPSSAAAAQPASGNPRYAYVVRDAGATGISGTDTQATTSLQEVNEQNMLQSRATSRGKTQEVVRVDLDKIPADRYTTVAGANGKPRVSFNSPLPEDVVERLGIVRQAADHASVETAPPTYRMYPAGRPLLASETPRYAYLVHDADAKGVPGTDAQGTTSLQEIHDQNLLQSRASSRGKTQEIIRIDLNQLSPDRYTTTKGANGKPQLTFTNPLPEDIVERLGIVRQPGRSRTRSATSAPANRSKAPQQSDADIGNLLSESLRQARARALAQSLSRARSALGEE